MFVKNTCKKAIGFGDLVLLPDESGQLPKGYDENHELVKFYIAKGWLEKAKGKKTEPTPTTTQEPELTEEEKAVIEAAEKAAAEKTAAIEAEIKEIEKMNLAPLQEKATELGIEWVAADTKAVLIEKITAKLKEE